MSGVILNVANTLLVIGIDPAGMTVPFPLGVGLALVIGTVESYFEAPKGNVWLLFVVIASAVAGPAISCVLGRAGYPDYRHLGSAHLARIGSRAKMGMATVKR